MAHRGNQHHYVVDQQNLLQTTLNFNFGEFVQPKGGPLALETIWPRVFSIKPTPFNKQFHSLQCHAINVATAVQEVLFSGGYIIMRHPVLFFGGAQSKKNVF